MKCFTSKIFFKKKKKKKGQKENAMINEGNDLQPKYSSVVFNFFMHLHLICIPNRNFLKNLYLQ